MINDHEINQETMKKQIEKEGKRETSARHGSGFIDLRYKRIQRQAVNSMMEVSKTEVSSGSVGKF